MLNSSFGSIGNTKSGFGGFSAFVTSPNKSDNAETNAQSKSQADKTKDESINQAVSTDILTGISNKIPLLIKPDKVDDGEHLAADSGNITRVATLNSRDIDIEANNQTEKSKVFMSMDGLLRPVSVDGDSDYPEFYKSIQSHCGEGTSEYQDDYCAEQEWFRITEASADTENGFDGTTTYYSQRPHPPIVGSGIDPAESSGPNAPDYSCDVVCPYDDADVVIPTGIYGADYQININYLNPFTNSNGHKNVHPDDTESMYLGHDIQLLSSKENQELKTRVELENSLMEEGSEIDLSYQSDYRALALRGPLLIQGWGYDLEGKPIPNYKDWYDDNTLEKARKGEFARDNLTDYFAPGWLKKSDSWPVAPVDLRFDRDRGVWVAPQPFKFIKARLKEAIPNSCYEDGAPAIIQEMDGKKIYDDQGIEIQEDRRRIFIKSDLGVTVPKDSVVRAYYDEQACEYRLLQKPDLDEPAMVLAMLQQDLEIPQDCDKIGHSGSSSSPGESESSSIVSESPSESYESESDCLITAQAFKIFVDDQGCEFALNSAGAAIAVKNIGAADAFNPHPDTTIQIANSLNQPIEKGTKVIVTKQFENGIFQAGSSPGEQGTVTTETTESTVYRVLQAEFCPLVVLTSIYIREDYPCILDAVYDNSFFYPNRFGICGTEGATAGGGISVCNKYAETEIALDINYCPPAPSVWCFSPAKCGEVNIPCCDEIVPAPPEPEPEDCGYCYYLKTEIWSHLYGNSPPFDRYSEVCWDEEVVVVDEYGFPVEEYGPNGEVVINTWRDYKLLSNGCTNGGKCTPVEEIDPNKCEETDDTALLQLVWDYMAIHCDEWNTEGYNELTLEDLKPYLCKYPCECEPTTNPPGDCDDDAGECLFITETFVLEVEGKFGCPIGSCVEDLISADDDNYYRVEGNCADNDPDSCKVPSEEACKEPDNNDVFAAIQWLKERCCMGGGVGGEGDEIEEPCICPNNDEFLEAIDDVWPGGYNAFVQQLRDNLCVTECDCTKVFPPTGTPYVPEDPTDPNPNPPSPSFYNTLYAKAATDFCFDIDVKVQYPSYPELKIDVGERMIYLQAMWSKVMGSYDRQGFQLDVNSKTPNVDADLPNMPTFNSRKTNHWWKNRPNEAPLQDMISSYAAQELNGQHAKENLEAPILNIERFNGFERVKDGGRNCCESYADADAEPLHPLDEAGAGDSYCSDDPESTSSTGGD